MSTPTKQRPSFTDEQLVSSYLSTRSVWKTAKEFGLCGQTVHERIRKYGVVSPPNGATSEQIAMIREAYSRPFRRGEGPLVGLARKLGMNHTNVCRIARRLGLTNNSRCVCDQVRNDMAERARRLIANNGHPRGMLGKRHTEETKRRISEAGMGRVPTPETIMKTMKTRIARYGRLATNIRRGSWRAGWREIGGKKIYARSRWEANYARYLEFLKQHEAIKDWEHEPKTFWFEAIKRGTRSYLPDFRVTENAGRQVYHEVKGWMDDASKTKIRRMAKYYPDVRLVVIQGDWFKANKNKLRGLISDWEEST